MLASYTAIDSVFLLLAGVVLLVAASVLLSLGHALPKWLGRAFLVAGVLLVGQGVGYAMALVVYKLYEWAL